MGGNDVNRPIPGWDFATQIKGAAIDLGHALRVGIVQFVGVVVDARVALDVGAMEVHRVRGPFVIELVLGNEPSVAVVDVEVALVLVAESPLRHLLKGISQVDGVLPRRVFANASSISLVEVVSKLWHAGNVPMAHQEPVKIPNCFSW